MSGLVHLAGPTLRVGSVVRVRCAWCGSLIDEVDLARVAVPEGQRHPADEVDAQDNPLPLWKGLVLIDGNMRVSVPELDGDRVPAGSCLDIDSEVTR